MRTSRWTTRSEARRGARALVRLTLPVMLFAIASSSHGQQPPSLDVPAYRGYQRHATTSNSGGGPTYGAARGHGTWSYLPRRHRLPARRQPRQEESAWFTRPFPYHLDYYRMRYGGSYAPYFGNFYGVPNIALGYPLLDYRLGYPAQPTAPATGRGGAGVWYW